MIGVSEEVRKDLQCDMLNNLIEADTKLIDGKHTGKFISNITNDVSHITNLISTAVLNIFKDSLTLIGLLDCNVFSKLETCFDSNHNDTFSYFCSKNFG